MKLKQALKDFYEMSKNSEEWILEDEESDEELEEEIRENELFDKITNIFLVVALLLMAIGMPHWIGLI